MSLFSCRGKQFGSLRPVTCFTVKNRPISATAEWRNAGESDVGFGAVEGRKSVKMNIKERMELKKFEPNMFLVTKHTNGSLEPLANDL